MTATHRDTREAAIFGRVRDNGSGRMSASVARQLLKLGF
jgi:hypothetical protein